ncbi:MAG TPA: DUF2855 family protein [Burkholderiaceae bacterium]|jgi:hypothetical protein
MADFSACEIREETVPVLQPGELLVEIEHLALTANTLTYAAMGDELGYWALFPASAPGLGRIPAWGHGRVLHSAVDGVGTDVRLFGLWPMASHAILRGRSSRLGLRETSPHRQRLNPVYNQYALSPPAQGEAAELRALFHPLFVTSFVLSRYLDEHDYFGASELAIVSASSKTALGTAFLVNGTRRLVGLTSNRNAPWLTQTRLYDTVLPYGNRHGLRDVERCLIVDFSGDRALVEAVSADLGHRCAGRIHVGATHGGSVGQGATPNDVGDQLFSGPQQIERYAAEWGPMEFDHRLQRALAAFTAALRPSFTLRHGDGADGMALAYRELQQGRVPGSTLLIARPVPPALEAVAEAQS